MVIVNLKVRNKNKNQKMSREPLGEQDGVMEAKVEPVSDDNVVTEVEFRPPRGTNWMSEEMPIITKPDPRTPGPHRTPPGTGRQPEESGSDRNADPNVSGARKAATGCRGKASNAG